MNRLAIQRRVKLSGLMLRPDAVSAIENVLSNTDEPDATLNKIIDNIQIYLIRQEQISSSSSLANDNGVMANVTEAANRIIDQTVILDVIADLSKKDSDMGNDAIAIIDAFSTPLYMLDEGLGPTSSAPLSAGTISSRKFRRVNDNERSFHCSAAMRASIIRDRFAITQQRLLRNPRFQRAGLSDVNANITFSKSNQQQMIALSSIESLISNEGDQVTIFGIITQIGQNQFYLEDLNSKVEIDLSHTKCGMGIFTEGCMVIASGRFSSETGKFKVNELSMPPAETRVDSIRASQGIDFIGRNLLHSIISSSATNGNLGDASYCNNIFLSDEEHLRKLEVEATDSMFVILSDVYLDDHSVTSKLHDLFKGFEDLAPPVIVLMGNYTSKPFGVGHGTSKQKSSFSQPASGRASNQQNSSSSFGNDQGGFHARDISAEQCTPAEFGELMESLGEMMCKFPKLLETTHFIFVPGPRDPGASGNILPRPPIPSLFSNRLKDRVLRHYPNSRITFTTNPSRLLFYLQEIVLFREDILSKMRRQSLFLQRDAQKSEDNTKAEMETEHSEVVHNSHKSNAPLTEHLVKSIVDQAHLCPLSQYARPVYWCYDSALRLFPLPHIIVLADHYDQYQMSHAGCGVFNPGSFASDFSFVVYRPSTWHTEFSRVP